MNWFETRRRMLMSGIDNRTYIFKEGEGLVWGYSQGCSSEYTYCSPEYIMVQGNSWGSGTDDDASYGMLLNGSSIEKNDDIGGTTYSTESGYDFIKYKTLYIELEVTDPGDYGIYGYAGFRANHETINSGYLHHSDNEFNSAYLTEMYKGGSKRTISPQSRHIISFDISDVMDAQIVFFSPFARDVLPKNYMKIYNIWVEGNIPMIIDETATYIYKIGDTSWNNVSEISFYPPDFNPIITFESNYAFIGGAASTGSRNGILSLKTNFTNYSSLVITYANGDSVGYGDSSGATFISEKNDSGNGRIRTYTFDISTLTGDYYIKLKHAISSLYIREIKLVP